MVDADYRGTLFVLLFNLSDTDYAVATGDRIAQLILERIVTPEVTETDVRAMNDDRVRHRLTDTRSR